MSRRWITLSVVIVTFLVALEGTVISTAMPRVVRELGGTEYYRWAFSAYLSALTVTGMVWGRLADARGLKLCYLSSVAIFLLGSLGCGAAPTMPWLVASRALQGIGGGGLTPLGQLALAQIYSPQERAKIQGLLVSVFGISSIMGPPLGGIIVEHWDWRWVFWLNLPFGLVGGLLLALFYPRAAAAGRSVDWLGAGLFCAWVGSMLGLFAGTPWALAPFVFTSWAVSRWGRGFLPLDLWEIAYVRTTSGVLVMIGMGVFACVNFLPLYLQSHFGQSGAQSGRSMLPLMISWIVSSALAPSWSLRWGSRPLVGAGCIALWVAYGLLARGNSLELIWLAGALVGLGGGLTFSPVMLSVQNVVPAPLLGSAIAGVSCLRMLGAACGTALLGLWIHAAPRTAFEVGWGLATVGVFGWLGMRGDDRERT